MSLAKEQGLNGHSMVSFIQTNASDLEASITQCDLQSAIERVGKSVGSSDIEKFKNWETDFGSA